MGMDLEPINPSDDAPRDSRGPVWGRYNWSGWDFITNKLGEWGELTGEFSFFNDGVVISEATCKRVADAIAAHLHELSAEDQAWLEPHIARWRTCGGYRQW